MTTALSIARIINSIYARAALEASINGTGRPALLDRSDEKALRRVVLDATATILGNLGSMIVSSDLEEAGTDTEIITVVTTIAHSDAVAPTFRMNLETAIVCAVLAEAYGGTGAKGDWYRELRSMAFVALPPSIRRAV